MDLMTVLAAILAISALVNVLQASAISRENREKTAIVLELDLAREAIKKHNAQLDEMTKNPPPPQEKLDVTAQDLLHDLMTRGHAVLRVEVLDMSNLLLRSPRG